MNGTAKDTVATTSQVKAPAASSPLLVFGKTFLVNFSMAEISLPMITTGWGKFLGSPNIWSSMNAVKVDNAISTGTPSLLISQALLYTPGFRPS